MFCARLARGSRGAKLAGWTRRSSAPWRLRIDVLHAAVLLSGSCDRSRFTSQYRLILWHARLTRWSCWARLIRVAWWSRLTGLLACTYGTRLSTLTRCALLALLTLLAAGLGKRGINVAVDVPRFVIVVTAIAVAITVSRIVHVIHLSEL